MQKGWHDSWGKAIMFHDDLLSVVQAAPIIMFAFTCQVNVFSIYDELEKQSMRRMSQVTNGASTECFCVSLLLLSLFSLSCLSSLFSLYQLYVSLTRQIYELFF